MKFFAWIRKHFIFIFIVIILFLIVFFFLWQRSDSCLSDLILYDSSFVFSTDSISDLQNKLTDIYHSEEKVAYLTFDDGPTKIATPKILEILRRQEVHASFFVIGYRVKEFPHIVKQAYEDGNFIANHGYSHKISKLYNSKEDFLAEIEETDKAIAEAIGVDYYQSHIFRFPNGSNSNQYCGVHQKCKDYLKWQPRKRK